MKTKFLKLAAAFFAAFLIIAPVSVAVVGCATPTQQSYAKAQDVPTIMAQWADYVVAERARIVSLPAEDRGTPTSDLLRAEGRVFNAYGAYQSAVAIVRSNPSPANTSKLTAAINTLVTTINNEKK